MEQRKLTTFLQCIKKAKNAVTVNFVRISGLGPYGIYEKIYPNSKIFSFLISLCILFILPLRTCCIIHHKIIKLTIPWFFNPYSGFHESLVFVFIAFNKFNLI